MARRTRLKVAIIESGHTQRQVARALDVTESRLSDIVTGTVNPRPYEETKLSEILGRSREFLFEDEALTGPADGCMTPASDKPTRDVEHEESAVRTV